MSDRNQIDQNSVRRKFSDILQEPFVSVADSVQGSHLVCLIDGKKLKMLSRHLRAKYGMSAEEYRAFFDLPEDYPMIAPDYAEAVAPVAPKLKSVSNVLFFRPPQRGRD